MSIVEFSLITYLVLYAKEILLTTSVFGGILLATAEGAGALGKPFFGFLSDKAFSGMRKSPFLLLGIITILCCIVTILMPKETPLLAFGFLFAIFGFTSIGWGGLLLTLVGEFGGKENAATATGFSAMVAYLGSTIGPPIFGFIIDLTNSYFWGWSFLTICATLGTVLIGLIREERRRA